MSESSTARSFLLGALLHLGLGAAALLAQALLPGRGASLVPLLVAVGGFSIFTVTGLTLYYFPSFVKRELASAVAASAVSVFFHAGLLTALAGWILKNPVAERMAGIVLGTGLVGFVFLAAASIGWGKPWRDGTPKPLSDTPYKAWDRAAAAAALASWVGLAFAAALMAFGRAPWGLAVLAALLIAFTLPALAAFFLHTLPRNLHRAPPGASVAGALVLLLATGGILIAGALANPFAASPLFVVGTAALVAGAIPLGVAVAVAPFRADRPGNLLRLARPHLAVAGTALAVGALVQAAAALTTGATPVEGLARAMAGVPFVAAAAGAASAAACTLGFPIALNATPRKGAPAPVGAVVMGLAAVAYAGGIVGWVPMGVVIGGALAVVWAGLAVSLLEPLRTPRRVCPPGAEA